MSTRRRLLSGDTDTPQARLLKKGEETGALDITLRDSSGVENAWDIEIDVEQSGTAGYVADRVNVVEVTTGTGGKKLLDRLVGGVSKFSVGTDGEPFKGTNQIFRSGQCTPAFTGATGSFGGAGQWVSIDGVLTVFAVITWDGSLTGSDVSIDLDLPAGSFANQSAQDGVQITLASVAGGTVASLKLTVPVPIGVALPVASSEVVLNKNYDPGSRLQYTDLPSASALAITFSGKYVFT